MFWVWGSIDTHDHIMRSYAAAAGCAVLGPDYALSPEAPFPQALEECAAVVRWVARNGAAQGRPEVRRKVREEEKAEDPEEASEREEKIRDGSWRGTETAVHDERRGRACQ